MDLTAIAILGVLGIAMGNQPATKYSCAAITVAAMVVWLLK